MRRFGEEVIEFCCPVTESVHNVIRLNDIQNEDAFRIVDCAYTQQTDFSMLINAYQERVCTCFWGEIKTHYCLNEQMPPLLARHVTSITTSASLNYRYPYLNIIVL